MAKQTAARPPMAACSLKCRCSSGLARALLRYWPCIQYCVTVALTSEDFLTFGSLLVPFSCPRKALFTSMAMAFTDDTASGCTGVANSANAVAREFSWGNTLRMSAIELRAIVQ